MAPMLTEPTLSNSACTNAAWKPVDSPNSALQKLLNDSPSANVLRAAQRDEYGNLHRQLQTTKPCSVCGESTRGIYYGAVACLPCKTFFVRYSSEVKPLKCRTGRQSCYINEATRVYCKSCRYAKCLRVGMKRKVRVQKPPPKSGEQLCAVCGDLANGLHFGVFTCEGCKKFFRRGLDEHSSYVCKQSSDCRMNPATRILCRLCRFQRCLDVGMSLEGIRFGRRRKQNHLDRGRNRSNSNSSSNSNSNSNNCSSDEDIGQQSLSSHMNFPDDQISNRSNDSSVIFNYTFNSVPNLIGEQAEIAQTFATDPPPQTMQWSASPPCDVRGSPQDLVSLQEYQGPAKDYPIQYPDVQTQNNVHQVDLGNVEVRGPCNGSVPSSAPTMDEAPSPSAIQYWQNSVPTVVTRMTPEQHKLISTALTLYEPQKLCFTIDPVSNNITTLPGLLALGKGNVDDGVVQNITNFVIFAKALPGFDRIDRSDQYTLIRLGSMENRILSSAVFETRSESDQLQEAYKQTNPAHCKFLKTTHAISKTVRLLNLDAIESCLLYILCLIAADRPGLRDPRSIEEVRSQYISAYASYLEDNNGDPYSRLNAIFSVIPRIRQMGRWYRELTSKIHFDVPHDQPASCSQECSPVPVVISPQYED